MWPHSEEGSLAGWSCVPMTKRKGQTGSWGQWASLLHRQDPRDRSLSPWPSPQSLGASWWRGGWRGDFAQRLRRAGHSEGSCRHGCFPLARQPVGLERLLCGQGAGASAGSRPDRSPVLGTSHSRRGTAAPTRGGLAALPTAPLPCSRCSHTWGTEAGLLGSVFPGVLAVSDRA